MQLPKSFFTGTTGTEGLGPVVNIINNEIEQQQILVCLLARHPCFIVQCLAGRKQELQSTVQLPECLDILVRGSCQLTI